MITFNHIGTIGRFGNQLFQYAVLYSLAKEKGYEFGVPYQNKSQNEYSHFCLPDAFHNLTAKDSTNMTPKNRYIEKLFSYDKDILNIEDNTDIFGYFQSEKYFKKHKNGILNEFKFNQNIMKIALDIKQKFGPCISLHVRLTDYVSSNGKYPVCSPEYYRSALEKVQDDCTIILFSDDKDAAIKHLNINKNVKILDINNKFVEMCVMSLCEYHIIANSSFSWWGAWLSDSKLTIAPKNWFGENHNIKSWDDIYPEGWIVI